MKKSYEPEHSSLVFWAGIFDIGIGLYWFYGIYTSFFTGRIPGFDWQTQHQIILGVLWTVFLGYGAPVPAKNFRQTLSLVAVLQKGYVYIPLFALNFGIQFYAWIVLITVWFRQPLPGPFKMFQGGWIPALIAAVVIIPVCRLGNILACRFIDKISRQEVRNNDDDHTGGVETYHAGWG